MIDAQSYPSVPSTQLLSDPDIFAQRIDEATHRLFGSEELGLAIRALTRQLREDCRRLRERGLSDTPTIAIVGLGAWGKSWLTRCFLEEHPDNEPVRSDIRTGRHGENRTDRLTWIAPQGVHVADELVKNEIVLRVPLHRMLDLGNPYQVIDTPGVSRGKASAQLVHRAVTSAPIKLLVTSVTEIRDGGYSALVRTIDGSVIIPVVLFEPKEDGQDQPLEEEQETVQSELRKWRTDAPAADIRSDEPIFMPHAAIFGAEPATRLVRQRLQKTLKPLLANPVQLETAIERQIRERIMQTRSEIRQRLELFRQRVSSSLETLERKQRQFPQRIFEELLGDEALFRAGLRQRFRVDWIERTPLVCFPYRSLLGILALTHGAWDRLVFSAFGSIPSLARTLFQTFKNVREARQVTRIWEERLQAQVEELLQGHFSTEVHNFRTALSACLRSEENPQTGAPPAIAIHLQGFSALETASRQILSDTVQRNRAGNFSVFLSAVLGFGSFIYLIAGPLAFLYGSYLEAHGGTLRALFTGQSLQNAFPELSLSMLLTSLLLSLAPAFLISLLAISWSCHGARVSGALRHIQEKYRAEIAERFADATLAIEIDDAEVEAARFLLTL